MSDLTFEELDHVLALARRHDALELSYRGAFVRLRPLVAERPRVEETEEEKKKAEKSIEERMAADPAFIAFTLGAGKVV